MPGIGMPEILVILVIALIVFGPRKLPELGKSIGQAMAKFRDASNDFKRTWEQEVDSEKYKLDSTTSTNESKLSEEPSSASKIDEKNEEPSDNGLVTAGSTSTSDKKNWI